MLIVTEFFYSAVRDANVNVVRLTIGSFGLPIIATNLHEHPPAISFCLTKRVYYHYAFERSFEWPI